MNIVQVVLRILILSSTTRRLFLKHLKGISGQGFESIDLKEIRFLISLKVHQRGRLSAIVSHAAAGWSGK
jgi:hypothetical protein